MFFFLSRLAPENLVSLDGFGSLVSRHIMWEIGGIDPNCHPLYTVTQPILHRANESWYDGVYIYVPCLSACASLATAWFVALTISSIFGDRLCLVVLCITIIIIINGTLARSLEPVVTECKEHTIRTQTKNKLMTSRHQKKNTRTRRRGNLHHGVRIYGANIG